MGEAKLNQDSMKRLENKDTGILQKTPFGHKEFVERYYVHRIAAFAVVIDSGKVLLVRQYRRNSLVWSFPGGLLEKNESLIEGVKREVFEETGARITPFAVVGLSNWAGPSIFPSDPYHHSGFSVFLAADYVEGELKPDKEEILEVGFYELDNLENMGVSKMYIQMTKMALEGKGLKMTNSKMVDELNYRFFFVEDCDFR